MAQDHNNEDNDEYQQFLADNLDQLNSLGIPELFWKTLQRKISSESFDGGNKFMLTHVAEDDSGIPVDSNYKVVVCDEEGLKHDDPKQIYLIDHACTWRSQEELRYYLDNMEGLKERLAGILNVSTTDYDCATEICKRSYNRSGTYSYPSEQPFDVWYLNDELGARVRHSSSPSVQSGVFRCAQMGGAFTVMWLLRDIRYGDEVTRDFVRPGTTPIKREVILCAYGLESSLPEELPVVSNLKPRPWYQEWSRIIGETTTAVEENDAERVQRESSGPLAIYSDIKSLVEAESNIFTIVSEPEDADVIWQADHWKNFDELRPDQLISQFPNEHLLTTKVCLSEVAKRLRQGYRQHPNWFSQSFDLKSEIETFVAQYNKNEANDADNTWILKAWNFAHGTSALISRDLLELVRHHECSIPYLVQKYIERPILLPNNDALKVKFDFRYHVVVKSFKPLKAAIVK
ncbi:unnamed protein product [Oikopleura dioica]|uniref:Tubulin--tyrosine ligase-like protein 12 SET-like domain-containing protein n=1 Tax=Oikopleura dioica TaxID=34765 RepID=E4YBG3_OIKDI|nr:unnamed protein product [Oikopleura dioica]